MKEKIMETATLLFSKKGYYQTSMDDVAAQAGVAKGSLYYHFTNKSQLFCETAVEGIDFMANEVQRIIDRDASPQETARSIIALFVDICLNYTGLTDMVMNELSSGIDADVLSTLKAARLRLIERVAAVLDEGKGVGAIRACDSRSAAAALVYFVYAYCRQSFADPKADKEAVTGQLAAILMQGLLR